jgi:hypothetical protein
MTQTTDPHNIVVIARDAFDEYGCGRLSVPSIVDNFVDACGIIPWY